MDNQNAQHAQHQVQRQVDQLLQEQGEYLPLEFLLQTGRLNYTDYEAWRNGEFDLLDDALFGDHQHIQQQLTHAANYLQRLGWQTQTVAYQAWCNETSQRLCFSQNSALDRSFHQRYHKPQDQPQLDMFTDTPATHWANCITQALIDRNPAQARCHLECLSDIAPDYVRLGELERLVEAAENLTTAVDDIATEMQRLQKTLMPLAQDLLGKESRNLLIPLWRRLSLALQDQPYQSTQPEMHISYTAIQAMDWDITRQAVAQLPHWQADPVLLKRHARACEQLHRRGDALMSWFNLCWQFPQQCVAIESSIDTELQQQWINFQELELELPTQTFPAWLLLNKPGFVQIVVVPSGDHVVTAYPKSYHTMYQLQSSIGQQANNNMALRAQLKQEDAALFQHYLNNIE